MANQLVKLRNIKRALRIDPTSNSTSQAISYIIGGRVDNFRIYKSFNFIDLIDGSTHEHLQVIVKKDLLKKPEIGSYLICKGNIVPSRGSKQAIEFQAHGLNFVGPCNPDKYLLAQAKDDLSDGFYRKNLHLRPRIDRFASLLRVRSELELGLHMIFKQMDFFHVHTPILSGNDSEASSDLFMVQRNTTMANEIQTSNKLDDDGDELKEKGNFKEDRGGNELAHQFANHSTFNPQIIDTNLSSSIGKISSGDQDYFQGKNVFMVTSAQLHLECLAASLSRVYCLSPCFRAEKSLSLRHLCEFLMLEAEEANITQLESLMNRVESIIKFSTQYLANISDCHEDFSSLVERNSNQENFDKLASSTYIRMTYEEALEILFKLENNMTAQQATGLTSALSATSQFGRNISRPDEKQLLDYCDNVPIFITNYPKELKPFYMKCDEQNRLAQCFDLIAPIGGEICGGSLREDDLDKLVANMQRLHSPKHQLKHLLHSDQSILPPSCPQTTVVGQASSNLDEQRSQTGSVASTMISENSKGVRGDGPTTRPSLKSESEQEQLKQLKTFDWYLDLRRFGSFPHGGFGIGFERLIQAMVGSKNIRDTLAFPRWAGRCQM